MVLRMERESQVLDIIENVYSAALDGGQWPTALTAIADLLGGVDTTLEVHREAGARPLFFAAGSRLPPSSVDDYLSHYAQICPRIPYLTTLATGSVGHDHAFLSERQMDQDEFYADFLGPEDLRYFAAGTLMNRPGMLGGVYVHRSPRQGPADEATLSLLKHLVPHLARALRLHFHLKMQSAREVGFLALIDRLPQAVVTLDDRSEIQFANEPAAAILKKADGVELHGRRLRLADAAANGRMTKALNDLFKGDLGAESLTDGQIVARRPSGRPPYVLAMYRLSAFRTVYENMAGPTAAIFIYDSAAAVRPRAPLLAQAFSLTRREAELAVALLQGRSLRERAEARGVKISTERSHLKSLMHKTGTRRQAELVRLLAGFVAQIN